MSDYLPREVDVDAVLKAPIQEIVKRDFLEKGNFLTCDPVLFSEALKTILAIPTVTSTFFALYKKDNSICLHANNREVVFNISIPIQEGNYDSKVIYFMEPKNLALFITGNPFKMTFDEVGKLSFETEYSKYEPETFNLNPSSAILIHPEPYDWEPFPISPTNVNRLHRLFQGAVMASDNKCLLMDNQISVNLRTHSLHMTSSTYESPIILRKSDFPVLIRMKPTEWAITSDRVWFKSESSVFSVPFPIYKEKEFPRFKLTGEREGKLSINTSNLQSACKIAQSFGADIFEFKVEKGKALLSISNRAVFHIGTGKLNKTQRFSADICQKVFNNFSSKECENFNMNIYRDGVEVEIPISPTNPTLIKYNFVKLIGV